MEQNSNNSQQNNNSSQQYSNNFQQNNDTPNASAEGESTAYTYSNSDADNVYMPVKTDNVYTLNIKNNFPFFCIGSLLYAVFYAFCLYKNPSGITYPFFMAGTLFFFFFLAKKMGMPFKKDSIFYIAGILLLGISNCLTSSYDLLFLNKTGIFLLSFILMLHTVYSDKDWNMPKYFLAIFETLMYCLTCIFRPFSDMGFYFDAEKQQKKAKNSYVFPVIIGIIITIPLMAVITLLLSSADAVFGNMVSRLFFSFDFLTVFGLLRLIVVVFLCSYAVFSALGLKTVREDVENKNNYEPVIAIIITGSLSFIYLIFSAIQIIYLFIGNMQLPENYTYAEYAREGFFQLLIVCILNLILVLICLHLFRENKVLKAILSIVSLCTYIMIASSALRMIMYINAYNLTFLRIFVLWALAVISFVMAGITACIYYKKFPLFNYSLVVVTVFYIGLSFAHPDYWIANYNLVKECEGYAERENGNNSGYAEDRNYASSQSTKNLSYLSSLSSDAAPVILNKDKNPYLLPMLEIMEKSQSPENYPDDYTYSTLWLREYYVKIQEKSDNMHLRNFNFSVYMAKKKLSCL